MLRGFSQCLFMQKNRFDSERRFTVVLENDNDVLKWVKPDKKTCKYTSAVKILRTRLCGRNEERQYICEPKRANEMEDELVQPKPRPQ